VRLAPDSQEIDRIDAALSEWRQGDVAAEEDWFIHAADPNLPLTPESAASETDGIQSIISEVEGLVVISQSCDIVRPCSDRRFVEVSPLVKVSEPLVHEIERGRRPAYAIVPAVRDRRLVADLDRVMTVEKAVVASWKRIPGCISDQAARDFARALVRKRARAAFPSDFCTFASKLQRRLQDKHGKNSDEGRALRALREIRVRAAPSWLADHVELTFWFVAESEEAEFEGQDWSCYLGAWEKLIRPAGRFTSVDCVACHLEDLTARDYIESDQLDLDHLSEGSG
jgi:hypothetical protein